MNLGMIHAHSSMVTGAALLASREMMAQRRPRVFAGANSLTIAYPVTISAPRPMPAPRRHTVRKVILGEKAPMSVNPPNSSRIQLVRHAAALEVADETSQQRADEQASEARGQESGVLLDGGPMRGQ